MARSRRMSVAEWVRQALDLARRAEPVGGVARKLAAVHAAAKHHFPTGDMDEMLAAIKSGDTARSYLATS